MRDPKAFLECDLSDGRLKLAGHDLHEGRFSRAITPKKRHTLAGFDLHTHTIKDAGAAESNCDIRKIDKSHRSVVKKVF